MSRGWTGEEGEIVRAAGEPDGKRDREFSSRSDAIRIRSTAIQPDAIRFKVIRFETIRSDAIRRGALR
ncbi:hypothetical protein GCM10022252_20850 [Streptosporangium oxazolinicum]|uniref:Uncharacterized protein n=1 Tax=Streptosporangium oxazolinicum TaxID=909287 RepID=A0ABP8APR1_9ACTN